MEVTVVRSKHEHVHATATINALLDAIGDNESHPLVEVLDYLADQVKAYEDTYFPNPDAEPCEVLRFLMEQHGRKQTDLIYCAPQSRISDFLHGRRSISKDIAKSLARRIQVPADVFL